MAIQELSLKNLGDLDNGRISEAFQQKLRSIMVDCFDRPVDKNPRNLEMKIAVKPQCTPSGEFDGVKVEFEIKSKVPVIRSKTFSMDGDRKGHLKFNPDSLDNVDQGTFLEE
jgi:hypothetical protein